MWSTFIAFHSFAIYSYWRPSGLNLHFALTVISDTCGFLSHIQGFETVVGD
jgi:hypothetical protein